MKNILFKLMVLTALSTVTMSCTKGGAIKGEWSNWDQKYQEMISSDWANDVDWLEENGYFTSQRSVWVSYHYNFVNHNTVERYSYTGYYYHKNPGSADRTERFFGRKVYLYKSAPEIYSYTFTDNKVIISNGAIYTLMNNKLYREGSSEYLTKN